MAYIPDEAIDRMYGELTSGARDLYTFLCRCRNQNTGKCCPSVSTTQDALKLSRARVFALRKELASKGWAEFDGNYAVWLFGFASLKNKTISEVAKEDSVTTVSSLVFKTVEIEESQKQDSPSLKNETASVETAAVIPFPTGSLKNETPAIEIAESLENETESLKNKTKKSQKQDSHIRKNQQREPAKRTSKESSAVAPAGSLTMRECYALFVEVRKTLGGYEAPYQNKQADFVQLAKLYKHCADTNWALTTERFTQAVMHYFATPRSTHTLADLAVNFDGFFKHAFDRWGKPITNGNGNGQPTPTATGRETPTHYADGREKPDGMKGFVC